MEITAFFFPVKTKGVGFYEVSEQWGMIKVFFYCQAVIILTRERKQS